MTEHVYQGREQAISVWQGFELLDGPKLWSPARPFEIKIGFELFDAEQFRQFLRTGKIVAPAPIPDPPYKLPMAGWTGGCCPLQQFAASRAEQFGFKNVWVASDYAYYGMMGGSTTWSVIPGWAGEFNRIFDGSHNEDKTIPERLEVWLDHAIANSIDYQPEV